MPRAPRDDDIGNGLCRTSARSAGVVSHPSNSASLRRITGIAFGWIGATMALASAVRNCAPPQVHCHGEHAATNQ